ncbi:MAG TPA: DUF3472 domain-containing protein [Gemmataceae bacterium]|nr:DUF3472 domain-containing protein [Gemmataceae bacterium]
MIHARGAAAAACVLPLLCAGGADEKAQTACRSVHLHYPAPEGVAFYNEVAVDSSARGTYFMVCGFDVGYFGIQELGDGKKVILFSVWDASDKNDPNAVEEEKRVKVLQNDEKVRVSRFGDEGTGAHCFLDYDWKVGETYRFLVTAKPDDKRTAYTACFCVPEDKEWKRLATFSMIAGGRGLRGYYSFIEDFRRNRVSAGEVRAAHYGNGWIKTKDGQWTALTRAKFTADSNPAVNINADVDGDRFVLATGGATKNSGAALGDKLDRPPAGVPSLAVLDGAPGW